MIFDTNIKAVCFDAFGTLVEIRDKRRPYIALLRQLDGKHRLDLKNRLMRENLSIEACISQFGAELSSQATQVILQDLECENQSIALRPRMGEIWDILRAGGYKIALCSNLAASYGKRLMDVLPGQPDVTILSYKTGHIKPEPEIYQHVTEALDLPASAVLFTGDTQSADVDGPIDFGMEAELIGSFTSRVLGDNTPL